MLAGNVVALLSPMIFVPVLTYAFGPQNYDYVSMSLIRLGDDKEMLEENDLDPELFSSRGDVTGTSSAEVENIATQKAQNEAAKLKKASVIAKSITAFMTIALLVLWPMPLYGTGYVFSRKFFTGWVSVGILWLFCSAFCVGVYPVVEGRHSMAHTFRGIVKDLTGRGKPKLQGREGTVEELDSREASQVTTEGEKGGAGDQVIKGE